MLAAGYTPDLDHARRTPFATSGTCPTAGRDGQTFIVSIDTEAETIGVQEMRAEAYGAD